MKSRKLFLSILFLILIFIGFKFIRNNNSKSSIIENQDTSENNLSSVKNKGEIYLAGGCFWGVEGYFKKIPGVLDTSVGYANGNTSDTNYEKIASTGHSAVSYTHLTLPTICSV